MGRQIQFYMLDEDEDDFLAFVRSTGDVRIYPKTTDTKCGEEFRTFRELAGRDFGEGCVVWNGSVSPEPIIRYYPKPGYFSIDFMASEVITVIRSKRIDHQLSLGRLHVETSVLLPDGTLGRKGEAFIKWYDSLCRWIRKHWPKRFDGAYLSPRAEALQHSGIELVGHRF